MGGLAALELGLRMNSPEARVIDTAAQAQEYDAWNPGIRSPVPTDIRPLSTLFRIDNVFTPLVEADELAAFTGLRAEEIMKLRPERLVIHELLVRVTADVSVPDGSSYEDLGINFREIVATILGKYIKPRMADIVRAYEDLEQRMNARIHDELSASLFAPPAAPSHGSRGGFFPRLLFGGKNSDRSTFRQDSAARENQLLQDWREKGLAAQDFESQIMYETLIKAVNSIRRVHGQFRGDISLLNSLVNNMSCNSCGSKIIGEILDPLVKEASDKEEFRLLPVQEKPIIMNTKGASASGKSTLRPLQKKLAKELGVEWTDFALISPDVWRKYLLDYDSLGEIYKYAGTLTGDEVAIIDQKLDAYMAAKAHDGRMSHLLIDRFRFDSFVSVVDESAGSTLLTRFGHEIYMFFMITPPEETIKRAWKRGKEVGRYKTVDDLLYHNVEAFTGMPKLFFTWMLKTDRSVHCEFLDNDVPIGERPRTVAFSINGELTILDIKKMLDVERYRKVNVEGTALSEIYPDAECMAADRNTQFLQDCAKLIPSITFADQTTGRVYGRMENGTINWTDGDTLAIVIQDEDTKAGLEILTGPLPENIDSKRQILNPLAVPTMGQWGDTSSS